MATPRPKESNTIGKEKKATSSSAHPITRKTTKASSTTATRSSSTDKKVMSTVKQVPNYLKPTISSRTDNRSQLLNKPKINEASPKSAEGRRRSFDKPPSKLPTQNNPSSSRLYKALLSPGPRQRLGSPSNRVSSTLPAKSVSTSPKPISDKISKKFRDVKTQVFLADGAVKRSGSVTVTKKSSVTSIDDIAPKSDENAEAVDVKLPKREVKEASNEEEAEKVEDDVHEHEELAVAEDHVNDADHDVEESIRQHQPAIDEAEGEKEIPRMEEVEEEHLQEEKPDIEHEEDENNTDNDVDKSIHDENQADEVHAVTEEQPETNEQKEGEENNEGTEHLENEKEKEEEESHEEVDDLKEKAVVEAEESKKNNEAAAPLNIQAARKKENNVSNDVIEETASKLLEARKNKVRALAGAFQTVIDYQSK